MNHTCQDPIESESISAFLLIWAVSTPPHSGFTSQIGGDREKSGEMIYAPALLRDWAFNQYYSRKRGPSK